MRKILVGIKGTATIIRADSDPMTDDEAQDQLIFVANAVAQGPSTLVRLPWLVVVASDVLFVRAISLPH